jgi:hypothetical protein
VWAFPANHQDENISGSAISTIVTAAFAAAHDRRFNMLKVAAADHDLEKVRLQFKAPGPQAR